MAIITISRGSYAGGRAVAERLAEHLGCPAVSREEVLSATTRDYGISEEELNKTLTGSGPFWQQVPGKRVAYVKCVTAAILDHAEDGNLVYHGIAGHLLLSTIPQVLRVRVIADMHYRVKATMDEANIKQEEAIAYIQRVDKQRSRWARLLYGVEWEDPSLYDLIINLGKVSEGTASTTIAGMAQQKEFEATPKNRKQLEDFSLGCRIWAALAKNPSTRSAGIEVTANGGEVVIGGKVGSTKALDLVQQIAEGVDGVKKVKCDFGVGTDWYW